MSEETQTPDFPDEFVREIMEEKKREQQCEMLDSLIDLYGEETVREMLE